MKIKVIPFDLQTINESNDITFIFMSVQKVRDAGHKLDRKFKTRLVFCRLFFIEHA